MPELPDDPEFQSVRASLDRQLVAGMGVEFAEKVWDIAEAISDQQSREAFQQGFRFAGHLLLAMLA